MAVIHRDSSHMSYAPSETNCALETNVPTLLSSNHSDQPDSPPSILSPHAVICALAPLCLSVLWDSFVELMQSLLQLGLNLHLMFAKSS